MEGLFFAINQVWFLYPMNIGYFVSTVLLGTLLYYIFRIRKISTKKAGIPITIFSYQSIDPYDSQYIAKTLIEIRAYLSKKYLPKHTWAHTSIDIGQYIKDTRLILIIKDLEYREFSGKTITPEEAKIMNNQLLQILA